MRACIRELAIIRSYEELQRALRCRAEELGVSNTTLDELCGFSDRYASNLRGCRRLLLRYCLRMLSCSRCDCIADIGIPAGSFGAASRHAITSWNCALIV